MLSPLEKIPSHQRCWVYGVLLPTLQPGSSPPWYHPRLLHLSPCRCCLYHLQGCLSPEFPCPKTRFFFSGYPMPVSGSDASVWLPAWNFVLRNSCFFCWKGFQERQRRRRLAYLGVVYIVYYIYVHVHQLILEKTTETTITVPRNLANTSTSINLIRLPVSMPQ